MMATLKITLRTGSEDALVGFPMFEDQYIDATDSPDVAVVELGERDDTTAAQEQFLNTNPSVVSYEIE